MANLCLIAVLLLLGVITTEWSNYLFIYLFIFGERGRAGEETSVCGCLSSTPYWGPGMWPDWESSKQPFGLQSSVQSTELHQPGLNEVTWICKILESNASTIPLRIKNEYGQNVVVEVRK